MLHTLDWNKDPFDHLIIDDFFSYDIAKKLEADFPPYDDPAWYCYRNAIENKKALNLWHLFPRITYKTFEELCGIKINGTTADFGLHGGGWHIHQNGGELNQHQDYQRHPKLGMQRKYNLIVYLSEDFKPEYGGCLGLWSGDEKAPHELVKTIEPKFNRCIIFDTTQNSWHGFVSPIKCPDGIYRKSIALYYLINEGGGSREKALFYPRPEQKDDPEVLALIERRSKGIYK